MTICIVCKSENTKYKCSNCYAPYCSLNCWKDHKNTPECEEAKTQRDLLNLNKKDGIVNKKQYVTDDTVGEEKLNLLDESTSLKALLENPCLRKILTTLDNSATPAVSMHQAMLDPLFVEFADECLKTIKMEYNGR